MKKLFVLVTFMLVASMSHSAGPGPKKEYERIESMLPFKLVEFGSCSHSTDFDDNKEKVEIQLTVRAPELFPKAHPEDRNHHPKKYLIRIDEKQTLGDLLTCLYRQPNLFVDSEDERIVRGAAIVDLDYCCHALLRRNPDTALKDLGIGLINSRIERVMIATLAKIRFSPGWFQLAAYNNYARFSYDHEICEPRKEEEGAKIPIKVRFPKEFEKAYPDDPDDCRAHQKSGVISIDEKQTLKDLLVCLYNRSNVFVDRRGESIVRGAAIVALCSGTSDLLQQPPDTVLKDLGIRNGEWCKEMTGILGDIRCSPAWSQLAAYNNYARFSVNLTKYEPRVLNSEE